MKFGQNDLLFKNDYNWKADGGDDPDYTAYLDRIKVDKTEGYEVLYFCNDYLKDNDKALTKENFQKIEGWLRLPKFRNVQLRKDLTDAFLEMDKISVKHS